MLKIFCVYFDRRPVWQSDCVEPLQAGKTRTGFDLGMMADDTGDNISAENVRYGEMTAWYWVWKNYLPEHPGLTHVGFSHYRRFLDFIGSGSKRTRRMTYWKFRRLFERHYREAELLARIGDADLVMRKAEDSGFRTLREQYRESRPGTLADFDNMVTLIREKHPADGLAIDAALGCGFLAMELQFVMKRDLFVNFMEWTFSLCREYERRWDWSGEREGPNARVPAFLVERLFLVWLSIRKSRQALTVKELSIVKLTGRPWWYRLAKPVILLLPKPVADKVYDRFK